MANAASRSSIEAPPTAADAGEISRISAEVMADTPAPHAPTAELPPAGGERPRVEVHEGTPPGKDGKADQTLEDLDELARSDPEKLEQYLKDLPEEALLDVVMLAFSWPEGKEISEKRARRIAYYGRRVIERHVQALRWLLAYVPETMLGIFLAYELWIRMPRRTEEPAGEVKSNA